MSMTLSGNGTITGLVSGGLPDGTVLPADLSTGGPYWDTSGNIGIGIVPISGVKLAVHQGTNVNFITANGITSGAIRLQGVNDAATAVIPMDFDASGYKWFINDSNQAMTLDSSGNLQFNSGYGSAATAYGCRAWVNFNGTGTVAIRASGNVSSITDNGTGAYTVNLTTAMPDTNYACAAATIGSPGSTPYYMLEHSSVGTRSTSSIPFYVLTAGGAPVDGTGEVSVFR